MDLIQEVYYELGRLNIILKNAKKSQFLLPLIVRQGVQSLNCNGKRVDFEKMFSPNVAEKPSKEVMIIVKLIKTINDLCAKEEFNIETIKSLVLSFNKQADVKKLESIEFAFTIDCLYEIFSCIYNQNPISMLTTCAVVNLFFVKSKLLNFPMLDFSNALLKVGFASDKESFCNLILFAIKSTISIIDRQKKLIKEDLVKAQSAGMKSVILEYNYLIENPVVEVGSMLEELEMTFATLSKATAILENLGILTKIAGSQRYRIFKYDALCELFSN
ncbi:MAG: hypothetical protein IJZ29_04825 [Clostridia bacterium]|nr:hypothetical protein [Clostridia bacterium]